jgi:HEAT repeat protein
MRPYLEDLIKRLTAPKLQQVGSLAVFASSLSVSFRAHREAEQLTDVSMVDELVEVVQGLTPEERSGCYFIIGKIGSKIGEERCAAVLLNLLPSETNKDNVARILDRLADIPKGPLFDLALVYPFLGAKQWRVRRAAIRALDNSANPEAEAHLIAHLTATVDPYDMADCQAVLGRIGTARALPVIERNLSSRKRDVKGTAQVAVASIRGRET